MGVIFSLIICLVAAGMAVGLVVLVLARDRRSLVHRLFATGMLGFAADAVLTALSLQADGPEKILLWQKLRLGVGGFVPALWLLFSLCFTREDRKDFLRRARWPLVLLLVVPGLLGVVFSGGLVRGAPLVDSSRWVLRLGWSGYLLQVFVLLTSVAVLVSLERTFRASRGHLRWQIKFLILGLGSLFAVRIYTGSQELIYRSLETGLQVVNLATLIVAGALMIRSLSRLRLLSLAFYPSHAFLYGSFTIVLAGIYFILIGVLASLVRYVGGEQTFAIQVFVVFLACVGLSVVLLSDRLRHRLRYFISVHLKRPRYDYRKEWVKFTEKTSSLIDAKDLCMAVAKMVSDTLEVLSVTVWLLDESEQRLRPVGSTVFSETGVGHRVPQEAERRIVEVLKGQGETFRFSGDMPVDLDDERIPWASELKRLMPDSIEEARVRYFVPLLAGGRVLGLMTLGERVGYEPFSFEEFDLLKTIADQTAASLLNRRLSEDLRKAKELEAFQSLSAFMIHDLKNLASSISLTAENLAVHFENPEFRKEALDVLAQSVAKIKALCSRLSQLGQKLEVKRAEVDLNEIVEATLREMAPSIKVEVVEDLQNVPPLCLDREQMTKVISNLVLNACEATPNGGRVSVATRPKNGWVVLEVSDNGCGMSREFMERSLFRPFRTTKKGGMGIGLYHSRMIVESHDGRIEVESEEGKGSRFRVLLPISREKVS